MCIYLYDTVKHDYMVIDNIGKFGESIAIYQYFTNWSLVSQLLNLNVTA